MTEAPRGTVTFLFTDIVGSTRLWEHHPGAMGEALRRHDALLREAVGRQSGHVFKTVGDAFCVAFSTPGQALASAIEAQRELASRDWGVLGSLAVRMGIHTGTAEARDGDYFGGTLNRAARIESAAHGGQILVSEITRSLLEDDRPEHTAFRSLGLHRLRNLDRPEHLYQVVAAGLEQDFPAPRSLEVLPNNLPTQTSSFVGREREIEEVKTRLAKARLLTLLGTGGTGKTRLSLEAGAQLIQSFDDGVWLVELALILEPARVAEAVVAAVGAKADPSQSPRETLVRYLRSRKILLLLDNCEHVLAAVADLTAHLLRNCSDLKVIATSRHSLGVAGEVTFPVPPLRMLDVRLVELSGPDIVERLSQYEAVRLFIDRVVAIRPDFVVTSANAPALAEICSRLDGIPLAIELAAARARVLDLDQIAARLDDRFRLLRGTTTGRLPHQQTLEALIDWSHDLLTETERVFLRRLGVFVGGRTLAGLEAVCVGGDIDESGILDLLQQLIDKSLVAVERDPGSEPRYTMIETVWHYARAKLEASGEMDRLRDRHLDYFVSFAEEASRRLEGRDQKEWLDRCDREIFNLRQAWEWCLKARHADGGFRLIRALCRFLEVRGNLEESLQLVNRMAELPTEGVETRVAAEFRLAAGRIAWAADRYALAREHDLEAERLFDVIGDAVGSARASALLSYLDRSEGRIDESEARLRKALVVARERGDRKLEAMALSGLGSVALERGDLTEARRLKEASLTLYGREGDLWVTALILWGLSHVAVDQGDTARARTALAEWAGIARHLGNRWMTPYLLDRCADVALVEGHAARAALCLGASEHWRNRNGEVLSGMDLEIHDDLVARLRQSMDATDLAAAWSEGGATPPWDLIDSGLAPTS
ncbi:MAG: adenylate/guanylate cyclase domain-containing protein [Limisphaerales bacterium]